MVKAARWADTCTPSEHCAEGEELCRADVCVAGAALCNDGLLTECNADGSGPEPGGRDCRLEGLVCRDGACVEDVCVPQCEDRECGPDPLCQESCGTCSGGETCLAGTCVVASPRAVKIEAHADRSCALLEDGIIRCWGAERFGELGNGGELTDELIVPTDVEGLTGPAIDFDVGEHHACAVLRGGDVQCWGRGLSGELGQGGITPGDDLATPATVVSLRRPAKAVGVGTGFTCAILDDTSVQCWGATTLTSMPGNTGGSTVPVDVESLSEYVEQLWFADRWGCVAQDFGRLSCWGDNRSGQLGMGWATTSEKLPRDVIEFDYGTVAYSGAAAASCGIDHRHVLHCWGDNWRRKLSLDPELDEDEVTRPSPVFGVEGSARAVTVGVAHICGIFDDGQIYCWGLDDHGQLGNGRPKEDADTPQRVAVIDRGAVALALGKSHSCALIDNGAVMCWGSDLAGQLGNGDPIGDQPEPGMVVGLTGAR